MRICIRICAVLRTAYEPIHKKLSTHKKCQPCIGTSPSTGVGSGLALAIAVGSGVLYDQASAIKSAMKSQTGIISSRLHPSAGPVVIHVPHYVIQTYRYLTSERGFPSFIKKGPTQNVYGFTHNTRPRGGQFVLSGSKGFRKSSGSHLKGSRRPRKKVT